MCKGGKGVVGPAQSVSSGNRLGCCVQFACCLTYTKPMCVVCLTFFPLCSIKAIGYDMDYTLIHYDVNAWEVR